MWPWAGSARRRDLAERRVFEAAEVLRATLDGHLDLEEGICEAAGILGRVEIDLCRNGQLPKAEVAA